MASDSFSIKPIKARLDNELVRRMNRAGLAVVGEVKRLLSVGQPVRRSASGRLVGLDPSSEGEPPHVLSGQLRESIKHVTTTEGEDVVTRIGTNKGYGRRQELGFTGTDSLGRNYNQGPRPYLRPGLKNAVPAIKRVFN